MLDKNEIYKCYLLSISPNATIDLNKTKKENIANLKLLPTKQIMVQPTENNNYVQEIITEELIPIYHIIEKESIFNKEKRFKNYSIKSNKRRNRIIYKKICFY